jgi:hypothetical protein
MSHQPLTISHFILAMFIISCNIQRAESDSIKISEGAECLLFKPSSFAEDELNKVCKGKEVI